MTGKNQILFGSKDRMAESPGLESATRTSTVVARHRNPKNNVPAENVRLILTAESATSTLDASHMVTELR
jgi:hypothetical protein